MSQSVDEHILARVKNAVVVKVSIIGDLWFGCWKGSTHKINYMDIFLPLSVKDASKLYLKSKLKRVGPQVISVHSTFLKNLERFWSSGWTNFGDLKVVDWAKIWDGEGKMSLRAFRSELRKFYEYCAIENLAGADEVMSATLYDWIAQPGRSPYKDIVMWHEERGAMTAAEQELLRSHLYYAENESVKDNCIRLLMWILFETLKRPTQILHIKNDGLWRVTSSGVDEYFLWIPKAKHQLADPPEAWPISKKLAEEIQMFSLRKGVNDAQKMEGRLLVLLGKRIGSAKRYVLGSFVRRWLKDRKIVSPRTGREFKLTLYRIRHTGATNLAMQGVSTSEIQYILEHEMPSACNAYIDAVGSELCPLIERADRALGFVFGSLNDSFFKGEIADGVGPNVIIIPSIEIPAVVGSCGSNCGCESHPFFSCYDGCPHFLAWRDADHTKALKYVESELARWELFEGRQDRSKAIKDFDRIYTSILEVIKRVAV